MKTKLLSGPSSGPLKLVCYDQVIEEQMAREAREEEKALDMVSHTKRHTKSSVKRVI